MSGKVPVVSDLIDTTEMYLRTVYELEEEGVPPLRARIAERLGQSGPTVSQTVQRMERDGLLRVADDRHIELTEVGRAKATSVMRKHRLAEVLLTEVIGLPLDLVHDEACRWEHVISDAVEERLAQILHDPSTSPYGNPIPLHGELGPEVPSVAQVCPLARVLPATGPIDVTIERLTEALQATPDMLSLVGRLGVVPGASVTAERSGSDLKIAVGEHSEVVDGDLAYHLFVKESAQ